MIGGGHAGVEAAWSAANCLGSEGAVALVTLDPSKIGVMSCNPAIGGLAKGQLVREIDALGGLMGLAADATGIQFKVLNTSKGAAVRGPRCQSDKHAYMRAVQSMIHARPEIEVIEGAAERLHVSGSDDDRCITGITIRTPSGDELDLHARAVVLTTGTFMRGLMHQGERQTPGGRVGESATTPMSEALRALGFELGRLRTGTPPRLKKSTLDWDTLEPQYGDADPTPFSELTPNGWSIGDLMLDRFPLLEQVECRQTRTNPVAHEHIRANLDRAPMYSGQIEGQGPRYCPSIEDKVVRFAHHETHGVFLEPESHESDWIYCNGIATSLPTDIQDIVVHTMEGCEDAQILQHGYAVEYDMVRPHQILVTGETRTVRNLYLAGQINGTSGYEEAGAQGLVAGLNAALRVRDREQVTFDRSQAYIGVLMDDLVTKTPREPYRMFTSRAEYRLLLRADNAPDRLTPIAIELGLLDHHELGIARRAHFEQRRAALETGAELMRTIKDGGKTLHDRALEASYAVDDLRRALEPALTERVGRVDRSICETLHADRRYEPYVARQNAEIKRRAEIERKRIPDWIDYGAFEALRTEARLALTKYRPSTFGQASRLEGITPSDVTLLSVLVKRAKDERNARELGAAS